MKIPVWAFHGDKDGAVKAGIKVVLVENDIPGWTGKSSVVATDNLAGGKLAGTWLAGHLPAKPRRRSGDECRLAKKGIGRRRRPCEQAATHRGTDGREAADHGQLEKVVDEGARATDHEDAGEHGACGGTDRSHASFLPRFPLRYPGYDKDPQAGWVRR